MYKCALILAAGKGTRMKSKLPKVAHKVCGKEMVNHVVDNLRKAGIEDVNVVVGNEAKIVKEITKERNVYYSLQEEQLGTGHAVLCAKEFLENKDGVVAIFTGDAPLITNETVESLIEYHINGKYDATILTSIIDTPFGYGRIVRNSEGKVEKIVEHKDCTDEELSVKEINSGMYCFDIAILMDKLHKIKNNNSQGEYYLPDVIEIIKNENGSIGAVDVSFDEIIGVNSRVQLAEAEMKMRERINKEHMDNGVTIIDPNGTYINADVIIGEDVIIYPGNVIEGKTIIEQDIVLYPNNRIYQSVIESGVTIQSSVILESRIGENTTVGPFAYIRPESNIGKNARIGDFVEIKKSSIGNGTKVSHLTYIGDAEVGEDCNFGCGTVVVNYDGKKKHKTIIGDNVFVGCNTNLVAPVEVEENSYIAAGSTITKKVPKESLAVARARQVVKEGWVKQKGLLK
ncbi:bifunctional UDP-N-acetylglucosamine diphosphorylase/glucosamine-1-phosphate N-acetyltransferase GlmU [Clostridium grantii]|uniref:Bifunctional protein GlmU n=1 Tax=Clostridium grantii DSM 8605 TaxID=1121316 RepID=A0A1M5X9N3_9CLOT|nr:bifunctional UDP-N-acetylglucosamine diphosphorylase/glucosamine-1-phosphate N-acetyltransferase GlmU [Clostridium grantii]SHH96244.1 UDP-N-acetylglucosamine pyrophosphorylase [Clostridium grantii DSM 8605]